MPLERAEGAGCGVGRFGCATGTHILTDSAQRGADVALQGAEFVRGGQRTAAKIALGVGADTGKVVGVTFIVHCQKHVGIVQKQTAALGMHGAFDLLGGNVKRAGR